MCTFHSRKHSFDLKLPHFTNSRELIWCIVKNVIFIVLGNMLILKCLFVTKFKVVRYVSVMKQITTTPWVDPWLEPDGFLATEVL